MISGEKKTCKTPHLKKYSTTASSSSPNSDSSEYYKDQIHLLKKQLKDLSNMVGIDIGYLFIEKCELSPYKPRTEKMKHKSLSPEHIMKASRSSDSSDFDVASPFSDLYDRYIIIYNKYHEVCEKNKLLSKENKILKKKLNKYQQLEEDYKQLLRENKYLEKSIESSEAVRREQKKYIDRVRSINSSSDPFLSLSETYSEGSIFDTTPTTPKRPSKST